MNDDIFTLDDNNNAAVRTVSVNGISEENKKDIFTLDENGNAAIRVVGPGGGSVDYNRVIEKSSSIPTADADTYRKVYMYVGETDANYTHGYIYECQKTSATYTGTVTFEAATLSGTTVTCDGDDFANFLTEAGADPTPIVSGTMTYDAGADGWRLVGKDAEDNTVTNFIEYTEDYTDYGFVFTGTPVDGDVIGFTCSVSESSATYGWVRLDVQPAPSGLPDQTGQSGKFLTTDGTDASWSDKPLVNTATGTNSVVSGAGANSNYNEATGFGYAVSCNAPGSVAIGMSAVAGGGTYEQGGIAIGRGATVGKRGGIAIGYGTEVKARFAIQLNASYNIAVNSDTNTFKVANDNGNFEIMSADGTIPAARHASLPATDGTYVLKLVISSGVPTLSWVAE